MAFSVLVLSRHVEGGVRIVNIAALTVLTSVLVFGLSEQPGIRWISARRGAERSREPRSSAV